MLTCTLSTHTHTHNLHMNALHPIHPHPPTHPTQNQLSVSETPLHIESTTMSKLPYTVYFSRNVIPFIRFSHYLMKVPRNRSRHQSNPLPRNLGANIGWVSRLLQLCYLRNLGANIGWVSRLLQLCYLSSFIPKALPSSVLDL